MKTTSSYFFRCLTVFFCATVFCAVNPVQANSTQIHNLSTINTESLGRKTLHLQETAQILSFAEVLQAHKENRFKPGDADVLTFGIGAVPVWIALTIINSQEQYEQRTLVIDNSWIDLLEVKIRHRSTGETQSYQAGDNFPFEQRPEIHRNFHFKVNFRPGISDIFIRVETPDPMVVPIYLLTRSEVSQQTSFDQYLYGLSYGYLIALLAYNAMLFFGLRDLRYLLYAIYLGTFTLTSFSYTGHGFMWLWPELVEWQRWGQPLNMLLTGLLGLTFAVWFLDIKNHSRRFFYTVYAIIASSFTLLGSAYLLNDQALGLLVAFVFILILVSLIIILGLTALAYGNPGARYFLTAVIGGTIGFTITATAVWGFIPYNNWTFRAADIGMLIEATLLALALAYRFRLVQAQQLHSEKLALIDPLTKLYNRRAFYEQANSNWSTAERHDRNLSVILLDLDSFKEINDTFGHAHGDQVLIDTAEALKNSIRIGDMASRWGGEEFILLLPETQVQEAHVFAERLRKNIEALNVTHDNQTIQFTASFGVAERSSEDKSIDTLIHRADEAMYVAKARGKNQVIEYTQSVLATS